MRYIGLNLSQAAIVESELANAGSAINTISLKLHLPTVAAAELKAAADTVIASADAFRGRLSLSAEEARFSISELPADPASLEQPTALDTVNDLVLLGDAVPMDLDGALYTATVFPLIEGGSFLYMRFHHVMIDGYGMSIVAQRVLDALAGNAVPASRFVTEKEPDHPDDLPYWREVFAGKEPMEPVFRNTPTDTEVNVQNHPLSAKMMQALSDYAASIGVSVPYVTAAAMLLYLSRAAGGGSNEATTLLMPRLNRNADTIGNIGCYTLLVPLLVSVDESEPFAALCRRAQEAGRAASAHKGCGFRHILAAAREQMGASGTLSEYVLNYYKYEYVSALPFTLDFSVAGAISNHVTVTLFENGNERNCRLDYRAGAYTEPRVTAFFDGLRTMLAAAVTNPQALCAELPHLGQAETDTLDGVVGKTVEISDTATIPSLLRAQAQKTPSAPALYAGEHAFTFKELDELTDRIAKNLVDRGIRVGDKVLFMLKRDYTLIPTLFGISKAGAAFIPVDPAYPADRIRYILENSEAAALVSSKEASGAAEGMDYIDVADLIDDEPQTTVLPDVKQDAVAYMIYTSGTTGRPKGVILTHKGIANITHPDNNPFNRFVTANCNGLVAIGSICFDISLFEIFVPLFNGKFIELGTESAMFDATVLAETIAAHRADMLHCTPSRVSSYLENEAFKNALKGVKAMLMAGEVLPGKLVKLLSDIYGISAFNGYGPTETTIGATITEAGDTKTIGKPIANAGVLVLGKNGQRLPYGAIGEICVFGNGVGVGYQNLPEQTAERFVTVCGKRVYRTGDLGCLTETGELLYKGRNDSQIKLRGLRIELSEIDSLLSAYPGIEQSAVIVREIDKTEHLAAFYTEHKNREPVDEAKLKAHLEERLTRYMVPDIFVRLDVMPQTVGGKLDVKALKNIPVECKTVFREPTTKNEIAICNAFCEILGKESVGLDDSFFEIGGDSLKAAALMVKIEENLELQPGVLEFSDIYKYYTPALLSEMLKDEKAHEAQNYNLKTLDYTGIDEYLAAHVGFDKQNVHSLGTVLLTGATGYLGIHLLTELLRRPNVCDKVICLARPSKRLDVERRIAAQMFYFEAVAVKPYYESGRCVVLEGDIQNEGLFKEKNDLKIDTVLNAAANVSHFAYGDILEEVNIGGVRHVIDFAKEQGATLCHVSTISVGGLTDDPHDTRVVTEKELFVDQLIFNQYIYTKYMAEYYLLRAAVDDGLPVKIFRVGNLQGRRSDGEFQMNKKSNAFTRQLLSYLKVGAVPRSVYEAQVNFSPIDETARNIVALCTAGDDTCVFHVSPKDGAEFKNIFAAFAKNGHPVEVMDDDAFEDLLTRLRTDKEQYAKIEGLLTERPDTRYVDIPIDVDYSLDTLKALGGGWLPVTEDYLTLYSTAISELMEWM